MIGQASTTSGLLPGYAEVVVVGTGFAGLGTAIALKKAGRQDFVVLERADSVAGTWRDNRYPGCACDVPSHLYSFSFAPNPDWTRTFSPQPEIEAYLRTTAADFGVLPHIRFGTELLEARWIDADQQWLITTSEGVIRCRYLVLGTGPLSEPSLPVIPGLDSFTGTTFHSATWDDAHDLTGENVAVIGTGASAIQFVPHVQQACGQLQLFQRTAPWVMPRRDRAISRAERRLYRAVPAAQKLNRAGIYAMREGMLLGFTRARFVMKLGERVASRHLQAQVSDPVKRAKLLPDYTLGCKRVLLSNAYYPALDQANADIVTDAIVEVLAAAIVTEDATGLRTEHPTDTIIFGTGFRVTDPPVAERIVGRNGVRLSELWSTAGMAAHRGLTLAGFPNLFLLVGPNTGLGHTSIVLMVEAQVGYLMDALAQLDARGLGSLEPTQRAQDDWNDGVQRQLQGTVWNTGGCSSWYLDARGRNTTLWPTHTFTFSRAMATCDLGEYSTVVRRAAPAALAS